MSIAKCKCDKIFDTDEELEQDEKGNSCCDNCYQDAHNTFTNDLILMNDYVKQMQNKYGDNLDIGGTQANFLSNLGYRKVK